MKKRNYIIREKRGRSWIIILVLALLSVIGLIVLISALTTEEQNALQDELNNLTQQVNDSGYEWPVNYSILFGRLNKSIYIHNIMYLDTYS